MKRHIGRRKRNQKDLYCWKIDKTEGETTREREMERRKRERDRKHCERICSTKRESEIGCVIGARKSFSN